MTNDLQIPDFGSKSGNQQVLHPYSCSLVCWQTRDGTFQGMGDHRIGTRVSFKILGINTVYKLYYILNLSSVRRGGKFSAYLE